MKISKWKREIKMEREQKGERSVTVKKPIHFCPY